MTIYRKIYDAHAFQLKDNFKLPKWFLKIMSDEEKEYNDKIAKDLINFTSLSFHRKIRYWIKETESKVKKIKTKKLCIDTGYGAIYEAKIGDWIVKSKERLFIVRKDKFNEKNGWYKK